ncbi:MAG: DUF3575 domain-containing protein [Flavobacteriaceae bacterium]|nr:DUF3575 domain-containing protein [Flavobacteriaceae bacterium]
MRYFLIPLFILLFTKAYCQDVQPVEVIKSDRQVTELFDELGDSEIKLDVLDFLTQPALNIGYEKINDSYSSYGADVFFNFNDNNSSSSWSEKFSLNPFYRFYFLNKTDFGGEGYFAEVFIKFSNIEYNRETYYYDPMPNEPYSTYEEIKVWDIAPGFGVGRKWVNKKGWTFEYMVGVGRFLFTNDGNDDCTNCGYDVYDNRPEATFKGGISIGKRF